MLWDQMAAVMLLAKELQRDRAKVEQEAAARENMAGKDAAAREARLEQEDAAMEARLKQAIYRRSRGKPMQKMRDQQRVGHYNLGWLCS